MAKLVYGVGINDRVYPVNINLRPTMEYNLWRNLLKRCYNSEYQKGCPTYKGCLVSENFKKYSYFYEWCQRQIGFAQEGFQLDKDLLSKNSRIYSEDTCVFIPSQLNNLLVSRKTYRGSLPLGVSAQGRRFKAQCSTEDSARSLGHFHTPELAHNAYKQAKESHIKVQAEKWKNSIDPRAYATLMAYEVLITD